MIIVSACLLGEKIRYDGTGQLCEVLLRDPRYRSHFVAVCPECAGGLSVPREPSEIKDGTGDDVLAGTAKVVDQSGDDISQSFIDGAEHVLKIAQQYGIRYAILKERSPSCGVHQIYDGSFQGNKRFGRGVCAALLCQNKIDVLSDEEITIEKLENIIKIE